MSRPTRKLNDDVRMEDFAKLSDRKRVDTHFHMATKTSAEAIEKYGDLAGINAPLVSYEDSVKAAELLGIEHPIISISAPGAAIAGPTEDGRRLARTFNEECEAMCHSSNDIWGFFGSLPDWNDVEGTLEEINHCWTRKPHGFIVMTSYGDKLLGHADFTKIWAKLDSLATTIFIHPTSVSIQPHLIADKLPQPAIDYPQQSTRTAIDLILTKTFTLLSRFKVILSHAGGTLPFLANRLEILDWNDMSKEELRSVFRTFYLDVALSTTKTSLYALLQFTTPDKILFGSDYPYSFAGTYSSTKMLDDIMDANEFPSLKGLYRDNASLLFNGRLGWKE